MGQAETFLGGRVCVGLAKEEREPQLAVDVGIPCDGADEESCERKGRTRVGERLSLAKLSSQISHHE